MWWYLNGFFIEARARERVIKEREPSERRNEWSLFCLLLSLALYSQCENARDEASVFNIHARERESDRERCEKCERADQWVSC